MLLVLARRNMLRPIRPDRLVKVGLALRSWGSTAAGAVVVNAVTRGGQPALVDDHESITYAQADAQTNAVARGLAGLGLAPGERLGILCRNSVGFVETLVGCSKVGADALLLNTSMAGPELGAVLVREQPRVLVHDGE